MFDEFKKINQQKKAAAAAEEEKKAQDAEAARQATEQMANMNVYQPPQKYMQQYNDPSFFNYEYQKYKAHLAASNEDDAQSAQPSTPSAITRN